MGGGGRRLNLGPHELIIIWCGKEIKLLLFTVTACTSKLPPGVYPSIASLFYHHRRLCHRCFSRRRRRHRGCSRPPLRLSSSASDLYVFRSIVNCTARECFPLFNGNLDNWSIYRVTDEGLFFTLFTIFFLLWFLSSTMPWQFCQICSCPSRTRQTSEPPNQCQQNVVADLTGHSVYHPSSTDLVHGERHRHGRGLWVPGWQFNRLFGRLNHGQACESPCEG